jgi:hypothetical protein
MENEPAELWSVFLAAGIAHEAFADFKTFAKLFKGTTSVWGYTWGTPDIEIPEIVSRSRRVMLRRMKREVLPDLPTKMYQSILVPVDRNALAACDAYLQKMGGIDRLAELIEQEELSFQTMASVRAALATAKIPAMLEIVRDHEEQEEPLLVFSAHRAPIDFLGRLNGWGVITGDESSEEKQEAAKKFQEGKLKGLGLTIRAGGTALTLTRAARQLFVDRDWKPTANAQAEDRSNRIGSTRGLVVMILEADHPLDRRVNQLLLKKQRLIAASVDAASAKEDAPILEGKQSSSDDGAIARLLAEQEIFLESASRADDGAEGGSLKKAQDAFEYAVALPFGSRSECLFKSEAWQVAEDAWRDGDNGEDDDCVKIAGFARRAVEFWWDQAQGWTSELNLKTSEAS